MNGWLSALVTVASSGIAATIIGAIFNFRLKGIERKNSENLETMRDTLLQQRDSRQARISLGRFATERAVELEFKAVQDVYAALAGLANAHEACRPDFGNVPANETPEQREERMLGDAMALQRALADAQRLLGTVRLFIPDDLHEVIRESMRPAHKEIVDISVFREDRFTTAGYLRASKIREEGYKVRSVAEKALRERLEELKRLPD